MPIYEYLCRECGSRFEAIVASDAVDVTCRVCRSPQIEKQLSTFAVAGDSNTASLEAAPGPCGSCSAAKQGMCQMMD